MRSAIIDALASIVGATGIRSAIDSTPPSRVIRATRNTKSHKQPNTSLSQWSTQTARQLRAGSPIGDVINSTFPVELPRDGTTVNRVHRALMSTRSEDERLLLWVTHSVLVFGIPGGAAFERTADRLRAREQLRHDRELHSAPARLSARSLTALPIAVLVLLVATSSDIRSFMQTRFGIGLLIIGLLFNECGRRTMRSVISPSHRQRRTQTSQELTDTLEEIALVVMAGVPLRTALIDVSSTAPASVQPMFQQLVWELNQGALLADALEAFGQHLKEADQRIVVPIIEGQRNGNPMSQVLSDLVTEIDTARERTEAQYVKTLPVRLAGPLVGCSLPAFVCLAIVPPLASSLAGLSTSPISSI
ncbi:MAG: type II secretion system F family protein [Ilumatobacteraceae bacterium]